MIIGLDVDGVLADTMTPWLARYNAEFDDNLTPEDITDWSIHDFVKPEARKRIYRLMDASIYDDTLPIAGALQGVRELRCLGHRIIFITSSMENQWGAKYGWLKRHGFIEARKDYFEAADKALVAADLLLDDYHTNVMRFSILRRAVLFNQPWNRRYYDLPRVCSWPDFTSYIRSIHEMQNMIFQPI